MLKRFSLSQFKADPMKVEPGTALMVKVADVGLDTDKGVHEDDDDDDKRILRFKISTGAVDREGDIIATTGWDLAEFKSAGVVLFAHNSRALPIAKPLDTWVEGSALKSRAQFPTAETHEFGNLVFRLLEQELLKATSVGFIPLEWKINEERRGTFGPGIDFLRQKLLEWSIVPVPANPEALIEAGQKDFDLRPLYEATQEALDSDTTLVFERESLGALYKLTQPLFKSAATIVDMAGAPIEDKDADPPVELSADDPGGDEPEGDDLSEPEGNAPIDIKDALQLAEKAEADLLDGMLDVAKGIQERGRLVSDANETKLHEIRSMLNDVLDKTISLQLDDSKDYDDSPVVIQDDGSIDMTESQLKTLLATVHRSVARQMQNREI